LPRCSRVVQKQFVGLVGGERGMDRGERNNGCRV
jgi:hypothetical protein